MSDPIPPLCVLPVVVGFFAGIDWLARRGGVYGATEPDWLPSGRVRRAPGVDGDRPYRAASPVDAEVVVPGGVPASVSIPALMAGALAALWTVALLLGFGDLPGALVGRRALGVTLASLGWCGLRMAVAWRLVCLLVPAQGRAFFRVTAVALMMDAALAWLPIPCSDVRADDVSVARAGLAVTVALALGFAGALWRRRGTRPLDELRGMN